MGQQIVFSSSLVPHTESNVILDWSSFVGDGLGVVPGSIFNFLSYEWTESA